MSVSLVSTQQVKIEEEQLSNNSVPETYTKSPEEPHPTLAKYLTHNPNTTSIIRDISNDDTYNPSTTNKSTTQNIKKPKSDQTSDSDAIKMEPNIVFYPWKMNHTRCEHQNQY